MMKRKLMVSAAFVVMVGASALATLSVTSAASERGLSPFTLAALQPKDGVPQAFIPETAGSTSMAGNFLASHFAQSENDWEAANKFIAAVLDQDPGNAELLKRSMVLAMGYGDIDLAARRAEQLLKFEETNSLALMFLAIKGLAGGDMDLAATTLDKMENGDMTDFIKPLLRGWADAGKGHLRKQGFNETAIHQYHAGMMAVYLGNMKEASSHADAIVALGGVTGQDAVRAGDIYAAAGEKDKARKLYEEVSAATGGSDGLTAARIDALKNGPEGAIATIIPPLKIKTPSQGAAMAMFDMAYLLYQEGSDNSSKLFANMTLALDPDLTEAHIILADALARNGRFEQAITHLTAVPTDHPAFIRSQRHAAELLAEAGRMDEALSLLNRLFIEHNDVEALITIGDLHRQKQNFESALKAYNQAATQIGRDIPEEYWHLLYARGMAYEREGNWAKAEKDLKAALVFRPDHPYLLNYLGYGWADKGQHLEESLELIRKAAELRPNDGYIIDSLGWVQYMMGRYDEAIPNLEKAVELLPYDATVNDHLGDAYWQGDRRREARFQWERAMNNAGDDEDLKTRISEKFHSGPPVTTAKPVKHASSGADAADVE